jgi:hypothetical protein
MSWLRSRASGGLFLILPRIFMFRRRLGISILSGQQLASQGGLCFEGLTIACLTVSY